MNDLISIIVPVYNIENYLPRCIESILAQTYRNFELILVNDGSTDNSGKICDRYAEKDQRITVIHQKNKGLSDARNTGISRARGTYIGFVDGDDHIAPDMYKNLSEALIKNNSDMAVANYCYVDDNGNEAENSFNFDMPDETLSPAQYIEKLFHQYAWFYVTAWNKLYKKELFENVRFQPGKQHEDQFIIHELILQCKKIVTISSVEYFYVQRNSSIMNSKISIKRFDEIEAMCHRKEFFNASKIHDYDDRLCDQILTNYLNLRIIFSPKTSAERERIKQIENRVKSAFIGNSPSEKKLISWYFTRTSTMCKLRKRALKDRLRERVKKLIKK